MSQNMPDQPLIDFHAFADLAPELQDAIWECESPLLISLFTWQFIY
jgi:hypothetical protein